MKPDLFFSVIIPTYNRVEFILLSVKSVLTQDYRNFEVIVVDDGSTDSTPEVMATVNDPRVRYVRIRNSERGAARNTGVRLAQGDYVTFLDSDDQYYSNYLSTANDGLKSSGFPVFYHQAYEVRNFLREKVRYAHDYDSHNIGFLVKGNPLSCLGVFIHREEALLFPFNEDRDLSGSEDWELWIRLAANFGLKKDNRVCACLILHDDRSVINVDEQKLVRRKLLAMQYSFKDPEVQRKFGAQWNKMDAYSDTYNSLHLMLDGQIRRSFYYFFKAMRTYPLCVLERRTLAIIKYFFINLFRRYRLSTSIF
ncbi:MAG: glycosyltransferase family 2 protein [Bacteroidia bacterium]|nr:glycosyltransferase family 2 protein [Bacteroidia bacterium]